MTIEANMGARRLAPLRPFRLSRLWRRPPLRVHLAVFATIIMIPALLFSAFLVLRFSQQQAEIAAAQVAETAEIISDSIDRELSTMVTMAKVLASSSAIDGSEPARFQARATMALDASDVEAMLFDRSLRVVVDTHEAAGAVRPAPIDTAAEETVLRTKVPAISDVFHSPRSDDIVFHVAVPVMRGEEVAYVLSLTRRASDLASFVADRNLPTAWSAIVTDRGGHRVVAALASGGKTRESRSVSFDNPVIDPALDEHAGEGMTEASYVSLLSGWTTRVAVPDAVIGQPIMRSWWLLAIAGLALFAFSLALAFLAGRRISAPIRSLARQANAIGRGEPAPPVGTDIAEIGDVSKVLAQASRDRREAEDQTRFLMREMTHRAKNQYALIAAIARRAARESASTNEFLDTLSEALASLARSADLLAGRGWSSATMAELVTSQLQSFGAGSSPQFVIDGPELKLNPTAAQTLGLALHELATNAAKYGALSTPEGRVHIAWALGPRFALTWREADGPTVVAPQRQGFGTLVTQKMTARGLGGTVDMRYDPAGVAWRLDCPHETVAAAS